MSKKEKNNSEVPAEIQKAHKEAIARNNKMDIDKKRKPENHLNSEYEINVNESYKLSMEIANGDKDQIEHLKEVLTAGPCHHDR